MALESTKMYMINLLARMAKARYLLLLLAAVGSLTLQVASAQGALSTSFCTNIVDPVKTAIGAISLALFITGGALYAFAHMLPAAGNLRGNLQGWSLGMIVGGVVGLIIVVIAPIILGDIISTSGTGISTASFSNC